jgi:hypothetical protein
MPALTTAWFTDHVPGRGKQITVGIGGDPGSVGGLLAKGKTPVALTDTEITIYGFYHLVGKEVQAFVGGLDCGDYTVAADGSIVVPLGSDNGGLCTAAYLLSLDGGDYGEQSASLSIVIASVNHDITIPIVVGQGYVTRGQGLRPAVAKDIGSPIGEALAKNRRAHIVGALLENCIGFTWGTNFTDLFPAQLTGADGNTALPETSLFSGVYRNSLADDFGFDSMLCWEVTRPWPMTVCAVSSFLEGEGT